MRRCVPAMALLLLPLLSLSAAAPAGVWLDVPFVRQMRNGCGAACIVMVVHYWVAKDPNLRRDTLTLASVQEALYSPRDHGIPASQMKGFLQRDGFRVFTFRGEASDLMDHLAKGRPLIVCLRESGLESPLHYVVVVGMDPGRGVVLVNDPARRKLAMIGRADFDRRWTAAHRWTLLAVPQPGP